MSVGRERVGREVRGCSRFRGLCMWDGGVLSLEVFV